MIKVLLPTVVTTVSGDGTTEGVEEVRHPR